MITLSERALSRAKIDQPRRESEFLIAAFLRIPRARLVLDRQTLLSEAQCDGIRAWVKKRQDRMPLAYVSGEQAFCDLSLKVQTSVLVPRPETELLVEQGLELLGQMGRPETVIDVGTGSGNIAVALSGHATLKRVMAIEKSAEALLVARQNAAHIGTRIPIEWRHADLLFGLKESGLKVDLIAANLPYVRSSVIPTLEPEVQWEPAMALDGGPDGLRLIEPCIQQAKFLMKPGGALVLEIGFDQADDVRQILEQEGHWRDIIIHQDLAGLPRVVVARGKG